MGGEEPSSRARCVTLDSFFRQKGLANVFVGLFTNDTQ
jgi:hypothetical protein